MTGLLDRHGTKAFTLPPRAVVTAAEADLQLRRRKSDGREAPGAQYSFHRRHVAKAACALELIDLAIKCRETGLASSKRATQLIYGDVDLLWAARAEASPIRRDVAA